MKKFLTKLNVFIEHIIRKLIYVTCRLLYVLIMAFIIAIIISSPFILIHLLK